jgi:hypothetical protein
MNFPQYPKDEVKVAVQTAMHPGPEDENDDWLYRAVFAIALTACVILNLVALN